MSQTEKRQQVLTFPDIGCAGLIAGIFLRDLGVTYIPAPSNQGAEKSAAFRSAPEDMCLPFKLFAAQLEQAWHQGANTVVMPSSRGPCRLGEFCELLRVLLRNRGCDYEWIVLDVPSDIGMKELLKRASQILPEVWRDKKHRKSLLKKLNQTRHLLKELEKFEQELRRDAGYYDKPKTASDLISDCKRELSGAGGLEDAFQIMGRYRWKKSQLQRDFSKTPVKIALTGEIFTLNEPSANMRIEDRLTELGVCLERDITLNWWIRTTLTDFIKNRSGGFGKKGNYLKNAYLPYEIGGYTKQTVEYAASAGLRGFDGVIQIFPSGCMPEIVGRAILNRVDEKEDIRVMTLVYDEMSGEAGMVTRLEAFTDMLQRARERKAGQIQ